MLVSNKTTSLRRINKAVRKLKKNRKRKLQPESASGSQKNDYRWDSNPSLQQLEIYTMVLK